MTRALWLWLLLLMGCGPGAVGLTYPGEPLFTVVGQLVTTGPAPSGPLRLAVAWYPDEQTSTAPKAIVTQDVEYQGRFPLNYTFSFFTVPKAGALQDYRVGEQVTRAAFGVLLAYEDVNGNGRLDTIVRGGGPVDRVLGASVGDTYNCAPVASPVWVAYIEGTPPQAWAGAAPGYNLYQNSGVVPPSTSVPISLTGSNELNFYVCEEFISGASYGYDLPCNLPPTDGVRVVGNLVLLDGVASGAFRVSDGFSALPDVRVEVNDAGVPFDAPSQLYLVPPSVPVQAPGANVVSVTAPGRSPLLFTVNAPDDFALQAPRDGSRVFAGSSVGVQWTRSAGTSFYQVVAFALTPPNASTPPVIVQGSSALSSSATLTGFTTDDTYQVQAAAFAPGYLAHGPGASLVNVSTSRATFIDVRPSDVGLWLEGSVLVSSANGQSSASVSVQGFDGVTMVSDAVVTANGAVLPYVARLEQYADAVEVGPGGEVTLAIARKDKSRKTFSVALPSDFIVTAPPTTHSKSAPLRLSWSPSNGASEYRFWVNDATRELFTGVTLATEAVIPPLDVAGDVTVTVAAIRRGKERHLVGMVLKSFDLTLTP